MWNWWFAIFNDENDYGRPVRIKYGKHQLQTTAGDCYLTAVQSQVTQQCYPQRRPFTLVGGSSHNGLWYIVIIRNIFLVVEPPADINKQGFWALFNCPCNSTGACCIVPCASRKLGYCRPWLLLWVICSVSTPSHVAAAVLLFYLPHHLPFSRGVKDLWSERVAAGCQCRWSAVSSILFKSMQELGSKSKQWNSFKQNNQIGN